MKKIYFGLVIIVIALMLTACNEEDDKKVKNEERVIPVETEKIKEGDIVIEKSIYGRTEPKGAMPVMVQNSGEVDQVEVKTGDKVEKNDPIATIQSPAGKQTIRAPKDGKITQLNVSEGELASTEDPIAIIADSDSLKLTFTVTDDDRDLLEVEDEFDVSIDNKNYKAKITSADAMPNDTGLYPIKATVKNKGNKLLPGMIAKLQVPETRIEKALIVPTQAVEEEGNESFIYVVKDNKAVRTVVSIKESQSDQTAIEGDFKVGDTVIVKGQLSLTDGSKVKVVKGE